MIDTGCGRKTSHILKGSCCCINEVRMVVPVSSCSQHLTISLELELELELELYFFNNHTTTECIYTDVKKRNERDEMRCDQVSS